MSSSSGSRRTEILKAASAVIVERGLADTRVADVAELLGVSPPLIMYYFDTKDQMLVEALTQSDRQFLDAVATAAGDSATPVERMSALIDASCPESQDDPVWLLWIETWPRSRFEKEVGAARHRMDARWRDTIASVVEDGQRDGSFPKSVAAAKFATKLAALIDGLAIQVVLGDADVDVSTMREICHDVAATDLGYRRP